MPATRRHARQQQVTGQASDAAGATVSELVAGMAGAPSIVAADGTLDVDRFQRYANDSIADSPVQSLALVDLVTSAERPGFEAELGHPIVDSAGSTAPAAPRDVYDAVRAVVPVTATTTQLLGVDLSLEPVRSEAIGEAIQGGDVVVSRPLPSLPSGSPAFFVAKPLYRPGSEGHPAAAVGAITTGFLGSTLLGEVTATLPPGTRVQILDAGQPLASTDPAPEGGPTRQLSVHGRTWEVRVQDVRPPDYAAAWLIGLVAAAVVALLGAAVLRDVRQERRLTRSTDALGRLADLSRRLAGVRDTDELATVVHDQLPVTVGAQFAAVGFIDDAARQVHVRWGPTADPSLVEHLPLVSLDEPSPVRTAATTGEPVLLADNAAVRAAGAPALARVLGRAGYEAVAVLPLCRAGTPIALVGATWTTPQRFTSAQRATLRVVAEVCEQTLDRIADEGERNARQLALAGLAGRLASAGTVDQVAEVLFEDAPAAIGASTVRMATLGDNGADLILRQPSSLGEPASGGLRIPLAERLPLTDAARENRPVLVQDRTELASQYPELAADPRFDRFQGIAASPLRDPYGKAIGVLGFGWTAPVDRASAVPASVDTIAGMASQTMLRAWLADHALAEGDLHRRLAGLAEQLAGASTEDEVAQALAANAADVVQAKSFSLAVADEGGSTLRVHSDPARAGLPGRRQREQSLDDDLPDVHAFTTNAMVVVASGAACRLSYPRLAPDMAAAGLESCLSAPLRDHEGKAVGSVTAAWAEPVDDELEYRVRIQRLADLAGQALERGRLTDRDARRASRVAVLGGALSRARTADQVVATMLAQAGATVGADQLAIALIDLNREEVVLHRRPPGVVAGEDERVVLPLDPGSADVVDAIVDDRAVLLHDPDEMRRHYPTPTQAETAAGLAARAVLPFRHADGSPLGAIVAGWRRPQTLDETTLSTLFTAARLCGQALQRALLHDLEHRLVGDILHRVSRPLPPIEGLEIAARHLPAESLVEMGGDWVAGVALTGGRLGLVVGDIGGHGIDAVADMAQLRSRTTALLEAEDSLVRVAELASQAVEGTDATLASAIFAVVDPATASISLLAAGHVPPMLRCAGAVEVINDGRRPLLGVTLVGDVYEPTERALPPGALFVAYTDGLVERREEPLDAGLARLRDTLASLPADATAEGAADVIIAALAGDGPRHDDMALIVVRVLPAAGDGKPHDHHA